MKTKYIWNPHTGITDLDDNWNELAASEMKSIRKIWGEQRDRLKGSKQLLRFTERMSREWAIETGIIENLYQIDRGITQTLIERGFHAELLIHGSTNKPTSYVVNLLKDQQNALDGVFSFIKQDRDISTSYIKELHACLVNSQDYTDAKDSYGKLMQIPLIKGDWKNQPNYPTREGLTYSYCPPEHVASEMDRLIELHKKHLLLGIPAEVEAAWLHHRFAQIHPFQDGNGRVGRALGSFVLIKSGLFPLIVTRDDKERYLTALEEADAGNLRPLVDLFSSLQRTQFRRATADSENILNEGTDISSLLDGLKRRAEESVATRRADRETVFNLAAILERDTEKTFEDLKSGLLEILNKIDPKSRVTINRSTAGKEHYYWGQIVKNAKENLNYFADVSSYRSWVSLNLIWERKTKLVFTFHGIGRPFSGSLVCAPFLEFRDIDSDDESTSTLVPVTDQVFMFFYTEDEESLIKRFKNWRENVLAIALNELGKTL